MTFSTKFGAMASHPVASVDSARHFRSDPRRNRLLNALPAADYQQLAPQLEHVRLEYGAVLCESGVRASHVYFPTTAIISLVHLTECGSSAEIAIVGNEGILGVSSFLGGGSTTSRALVQSAGCAYRMSAVQLSREFSRLDSLMRILLLYTQALSAQAAQTAVCNRHHSLEQQVCRRLLLSLDRLDSNELAMTQELIANLLGVRREGVTEAAGKVQHAGLVSYHRGRIIVLDRAGVEARSCECYRVVKDEYDRLLPDSLQLRQMAAPDRACSLSVLSGGRAAEFRWPASGSIGRGVA